MDGAGLILDTSSFIASAMNPSRVPDEMDFFSREKTKKKSSSSPSVDEEVDVSGVVVMTADHKVPSLNCQNDLNVNVGSFLFLFFFFNFLDLDIYDSSDLIEFSLLDLDRPGCIC